MSDLPGALTRMMREGLRPEAAGDGMALPDAAGVLSGMLFPVLQAVWPVLVGAMLGVAVGAMMQTGGVLVWSRPRATLTQRLAAMSSPRGWGGSLTGLAWMMAGLACAGTVLMSRWPQVAGAMRASLPYGLMIGGRAIGTAVLAAFGGLAALAVVDVMLARARWRDQLAMTVQEAREEQRAGEGDPQLRADRLRRARARRHALLRARGAGVDGRGRARHPRGTPLHGVSVGERDA